MNKTGLPEDVAQIMDRARDVKDEVPADVRARMLQRLNASVAAGVTAPMPPPPSSSWGSAGAWVTVGVTCVLLIGSGAWWWNGRVLPQPAVSPPVAPKTAVVQPAPPAVVANTRETPVTVEEPVAAPPAKTVRTPARAVVRPASPAVEQRETQPVVVPAEQAAPADEEDALFAERALLDAARSGLGAGHTQDARASLAEHARAHPNGKLLEERRALEVLVLAREGKTEAARDAAAAFSRSWPKSVFLPSIQRAVQP